jgi:hypothetical protein
MIDPLFQVMFFVEALANDHRHFRVSIQIERLAAGKGQDLPCDEKRATVRYNKVNFFARGACGSAGNLLHWWNVPRVAGQACPWLSDGRRKGSYAATTLINRRR